MTGELQVARKHQFVPEPLCGRLPSGVRGRDPPAHVRTVASPGYQTSQVLVRPGIDAGLNRRGDLCW